MHHFMVWKVGAQDDMTWRNYIVVLLLLSGVPFVLSSLQELFIWWHQPYQTSLHDSSKDYLAV